jgi:hypothetical protein
LVVFALINAALLRLRHKRVRSQEIHVSVPIWFPAAGLVASVAMIATALLQ